MNADEIKNQLKDKANKTLENIKSIGKASEREVHETYLASEILLKLSKGDDVSTEQITFLKQQSIDLAKAVTLIGLQAIPGSSIAIIAIEKIGQKNGFTLFPQAQKNLDNL